MLGTHGYALLPLLTAPGRGGPPHFTEEATEARRQHPGWKHILSLNPGKSLPLRASVSTPRGQDSRGLPPLPLLQDAAEGLRAAGPAGSQHPSSLCHQGRRGGSSKVTQPGPEVPVWAATDHRHPRTDTAPTAKGSPVQVPQTSRSQQNQSRCTGKVPTGQPSLGQAVRPAPSFPVQPPRSSNGPGSVDDSLLPSHALVLGLSSPTCRMHAHLTSLGQLQPKGPHGGQPGPARHSGY